jgi:hypothetical protein
VRRIEKNRAGLKAPVLGELKMNKTMKEIALLLFGVCVLLLQACEGNKFLESAAEKLNPPSPSPVSMDWEPDNIYINPKEKSIDGATGMITGTYRNGGQKIWFKKTSSLNGVWKLVSSDEENYPAGSIAAILTNNTSPSTHNGTLGNMITLNFAADTSAVGSIINVDDGTGSGSVISTAFATPDAGGVKYSFILTPSAFTGADATTVTDNLRHDFSLIMPSYAGYAKQALERFEYGSISVSWEAGSLAIVAANSGIEPTNDDIAAEMEVIAVGSITTNVETQLKNIFEDPDVDKFIFGGGDMIAGWQPTLASVISSVIKAGSGSVDLRNYRLSLSKFTYEDSGGEGDDPPVEVQATIVVPVEFINNSPPPPDPGTPTP